MLRLASLLLSCALLAACATSPTLASVRDGIVRGAIQPNTYDFAALRFEAGLQMDALNTAVSPSGERRQFGCDDETLRRMAALPWIDLANAAPSAEAARTDAAAPREHLTRLAGEDGATDMALQYFQGRDRESDPRLRELYDRTGRDQRGRAALSEPSWREGLSPIAAAQWEPLVWAHMSAIDCGNTAWLQHQLQEIEWFDIPTYGGGADNGAWLLAQHASRTPSLQREVVTRLQRLPPGATNPQNLAYLTDRLASNSGRAQTYGTQGQCLPEGGWGPFPIEDEAQVDARRAGIGLPPMAEYRAAFIANGRCPAPATQSAN